VGLQFLALQNVGCSINACSALRQLLVNSSHLTCLHFFNNMTDNAGATSIAEATPPPPPLPCPAPRRSRPPLLPAWKCYLAVTWFEYLQDSILIRMGPGLGCSMVLTTVQELGCRTC